MKVGVLLVFQNWHDNLSDEEMFLSEIRLGEMAETLGYDSVWSVEHHFDDYSMCPDATQSLTYLAGRTNSITLGTGAVILPWNDPLRVAEKIVLLDHLAGGRLVFGMGRGLAKMEYTGFRQDMNEARERFDEAALMITKALETGVIEGNGPFYPQPRVDIRPKPSRSFKDRTYSVAMSPDSVDAAAELGVGMMTFLQVAMTDHLPAVDRYRELFRAAHGTEPKPPTFSEFLYCHPDADEAEAVARRYLSQYFLSVVKHYEFSGTHFGETKGYQAYDQGARMIREAGLEAAAAAYAAAQPWGTPDQIIEKLSAQKDVMGDLDINVVFSYAGLPFDKVEESFTLFSKEVLPALREL
jgi:alkanesulfonate monooxygenase SsuD/methylene tetrahydromethanopterin reductase-like flavin-dependent oxidoreductase (luciferase family)